MKRMTREAASRIQSAACKAGQGVVVAGSFASRAMSTAYKNEPISQTHTSQSDSTCSLCCKIGFFAVAATTVGAVATYYLTM